jgi:5-methylcytosine-specific restriction endonuclease McrA
MTGEVVAMEATSEAARSRRVAGGRALVLNVTYEPISVVSQRRALVLSLNGKAEILHAADERVRSEASAYDLPSVVRLGYHVKVPFRRRAPLNRRAVFARDGHRCVYCGRPAECIDHVHPRSRGGQHVWENVVAACRTCNLHKSDKDLADTPYNMARRPAAPPAFSWVALTVGRIPDDWAQYLPEDVSIPA